MIEFDFKISGIPCIVKVLSIHYTPMNWGATMADAEPADGDIEYQILDRNGRKAEWLERKISSIEEDDIWHEALQQGGLV